MTMKMIFSFLCFVFAGIVQGQVLKVSAGTNLTIVSGTTFRADSLLLIPSSNFVISDNEVIKSSSIVHTSANSHILRVYKFTNNTGAFNGAIRFAYTDGAELNGIAENELSLNLHDGISWQAFAPATRDATNNFVLTNSVSVTNISELTLASSMSALPLKWISFTANKQQQTVLLQWATAEEQNTRTFTVQHSCNGFTWTTIGSIAASGGNTNHYSYTHVNPACDINYYRVSQADLDNRSSYSNIKAVQFSNAADFFTVLVNPVINNLLKVQVNTATTLTLYSYDGTVIWQDKVTPGIKNIDVTRYPKGTYFLKANFTTKRVVL